MPSSIVSLIREGKRLHLPETGPVSELWERALQVVLEAEGPPHEPIPGISSEVRTAIARSPKGRPLYLCHSWETAGWTCLLLDLAPVVMGRPIFLKNPTGKGPGRAVTDYQSQKFQRRIGAACIALGLQPPGEPSRLCSRLDLGRLFLAWSPMEGATPPALKGDLDNYAKNIMDGLQRARIVTNDRTIASIGFSRETLPAPGQTLDELLIRDLLEVRARYLTQPTTISRIRDALEPIRDMLRRARKGNKGKEEGERAEIIASITTILDRTDSAHLMGLSFSPVRRYPSLFAGPLSVGGILGAQLWARVTAAVGVSATLFLPTISGAMSSGYMTAKLAIPRGLVRSVGPVTCSWITSTPTVFRPADEAIPFFCYPRPTDDVDEDGATADNDAGTFRAWTDTIASAIATAAADAAGGTLVLCTAFRDTSSLRTRLAVPLGDRLLTQTHGVTIQAQKPTFVTMGRAGQRPVWLASGSAWTGLNLRDEQAADPADDKLVTDLIIVRTPIGLNRTSTHWRRKAVLKWQAELFEACIRMRQGIGRLVRREGLLNRRIWVLDGRLYSPQHTHFRAVRRLLDNYNEQRFTPSTTPHA